MNFHDIRMPEFIETFAVGKPEFATSCAITLSGREVRNLDREYARQKYLIKNCRLSSLEFEQFSSFFRARRGGNFSFRFRDNVDYQVSGQFIAEGDGKLTKCQLVKLYEDPISPYTRTINKPVAGSEEFYVNGVNLEVQVDYNTGVLTLPRPLDKDQILTGNFIFDVAVRFTNDSFEYSYSPDGSIELSPIELLEVI
ncbi:MAG: TIGR02217 family protein [Rickettsia endosymbiont of Pseudomimeciton antennatum]|nr:TIGR02217 family protein [Rickettsia endosymbiont of Pseudomimeciton antennatum]MCC8397795.1 TIGR02217 family protein [Rickettsia endosymbiont of Labidopullus appendiculatus]